MIHEHDQMITADDGVAWHLSRTAATRMKSLEVISRYIIALTVG